MANRIIDTEKISAGRALKNLAVNFCIIFTLFILFSCVFGLIFADETAKSGIMMCLAIGAVVLACAILQSIFFTPLLIKRMSYGPRLALFGICLYVLLAICAAALDWFPVQDMGAWIGFTFTYLIILALMTALFTAVYRRSTRELSDSLERFKEENKTR